ncbi:hypothetical protein MD588_21655 [Photobacterium sp. SDRW27]|uniref:hypothetical protein n=1 Tax=Photobacterium obscurum TaxID=2829490 RepID=UPI0022433189|nr:hypothetical protein [Photobacterium obscurum]MCW8331403.1 hypothetical protein [Photobacterium obscurum]
MSLKIMSFLIAHATLTDVNIWEYPSPVVQASSELETGRYCPIAHQFIRSGEQLAQVPLTTDRKMGTMMIVEKGGKQYIISLRGVPTYTATQVEKANEIFLED